MLTQLIEGKCFDIVPSGNRTFGELSEKYYTEYSPKKAPSTYVRDRSLFNHRNRHFGEYKLSQISPKIISKYKVSRRSERAAPKTINHELSLMCHAFNMALKGWEWVNSNPVYLVSKEKTEDFIERWLTVEEEELLLEASPPWL